mgnify:CR=1 FL=1
MSDKRLTTLRPNGWLIGDFGDGHTVEYETVQCVHCGMHFPLMPGSGKIRGYCMRCAGPVCSPACAECIPTDRLLYCLETGKTPEQMPITVSVSAAPPRQSEGGILLP